jgi:hypothetical protein
MATNPAPPGDGAHATNDRPDESTSNNTCLAVEELMGVRFRLQRPESMPPTATEGTLTAFVDEQHIHNGNVYRCCFQHGKFLEVANSSPAI